MRSAVAANSQSACSSGGWGLRSSLNPPPLSFHPPTALIFRQNRFQAALLCSQRAAARLFVMGGREPSRPERNSLNSNLHSCSLSILEELPRHRYSDLIGLGCITTLYVQCFLPKCQTNKLSDSHMDGRGRRSGLFFFALS